MVNEEQVRRNMNKHQYETKLSWLNDTARHRSTVLQTERTEALIPAEKEHQKMCDPLNKAYQKEREKIYESFRPQMNKLDALLAQEKKDLLDEYMKST